MAATLTDLKKYKNIFNVIDFINIDLRFAAGTKRSQNVKLTFYVTFLWEEFS